MRQTHPKDLLNFARGDLLRHFGRTPLPILRAFGMASLLGIGCNPPPAAPSSEISMDTLSVSENASLRTAFIAARQKSAGPAYLYAPSPDGATSAFQAANPAQGYSVKLTSAGASVVQHKTELSLRLAAWGCTSSMQPVLHRPPHQSIAQKDSSKFLRAEYGDSADKEGIVEWYQNGPMGLEQGFVVAAPPTCLQDAEN